ncbi:hypothetical protein [Nonomuraea sp. NPDC049709]|uniref:hypothetical protein n=1 Tax=Nonomuraea sp. NPDC049709 TaxID=3154736 RepID=UPI003436DFE5
MTGADRQINLGEYRLREQQRNVILTLIACAGLGLLVSGPTWGSLGLAIVQASGALAILVLPLFVVAAVGFRPSATAALVTLQAMVELLRVGLVTWADLGAAEAAWMGLWSHLLSLVGGLLFATIAVEVNAARSDPADLTSQYPGSLVSPRRLLASVSDICNAVAQCLLVAWSPWLVLVIIATRTTTTLFSERSGTGIRTWIPVADGYALLALALVLWLK